jgi:hypothetical protein
MRHYLMTALWCVVIIVAAIIGAAVLDGIFGLR